MKIPAKRKKLAPQGATDLKPADFPLGSVQSRAAARALVKAKEKDKAIVKILSFDWEPDHAPELRNFFEDREVWTVPEDSWERFAECETKAPFHIPAKPARSAGFRRSIQNNSSIVRWTPPLDPSSRYRLFSIGDPIRFAFSRSTTTLRSDKGSRPSRPRGRT